MCLTSRIAAGLFLASLALHLAAPAKRLVPEAVVFAVRVLRCATPPAPGGPSDGVRVRVPAAAAAAAAAPDVPAPDLAGMPPAPKWLLPEGGWACAASGAAGVASLEPARALASGPDDADYFASDGFRASALAAAMALTRRAADVFAAAAALPELLAPACAALRALGAAGLPQVRFCRCIFNPV